MTDSETYIDRATLATLVEQADLSQLDEHSPTLDVAPGYSLGLIIDLDRDASLDDEDEALIGRLHWTPRHDQARPTSMDGAARIIDRDGYGAVCWWQPPADLTKGRWAAEHPEAVRNLERWIHDRWDMGYSAVELTLYGPPPATNPDDWRYQGGYRAPRPELAQASLGGIDEITDGYLPELLSSLQDDIATHLRSLQ